MSEYTYTAEDFEQAEFAIDPREDHPLARRWVRFYADDDFPWKNGLGVWRTSEDMAERRCIPVYAEPYSPEALQRAWEHGEKPTPGEKATEGTVSIVATDKHLSLHASGDGGGFTSIERIIYRPPVPEADPDPVERQRNRDAIYAHLCDLAGTMIIDDDTLDGWAGTLVERGVRVVADDE